MGTQDLAAYYEFEIGLNASGNIATGSETVASTKTMKWHGVRYDKNMFPPQENIQNGFEAFITALFCASSVVITNCVVEREAL